MSEMLRFVVQCEHDTACFSCEFSQILAHFHRVYACSYHVKVACSIDVSIVLFDFARIHTEKYKTDCFHTVWLAFLSVILYVLYLSC